MKYDPFKIVSRLDFCVKDVLGLRYLSEQEWRDKKIAVTFFIVSIPCIVLDKKYFPFYLW